MYCEWQNSQIDEKIEWQGATLQLVGFHSKSKCVKTAQRCQSACPCVCSGVYVCLCGRLRDADAMEPWGRGCDRFLLCTGTHSPSRARPSGIVRIVVHPGVNCVQGNLGNISMSYARETSLHPHQLALENFSCCIIQWWAQCTVWSVELCGHQIVDFECVFLLLYTIYSILLLVTIKLQISIKKCLWTTRSTSWGPITVKTHEIKRNCNEMFLILGKNK